jgi:hypothetical protein
MNNISGFGLSAQVTASNTFPNGFPVTEFADDADPLDSPDLEATDTAFGLNGDMVVWSRPAGIEITMNVIPTSAADQNLAALLDANRVGKNKAGARDQVGIVFTYPNGMIVNVSPGVIVSGSIIPQVSSAGRIKTRLYRFRFQNVSKSGGQ